MIYRSSSADTFELLFKTNVSGDDDDGSELSRYRDNLERADFAEKLFRFERLTSADASVADHRPSLSSSSSSSRPSSAPLTSAARHGTPADRLRHSAITGSDLTPAVTFTATRGWIRRGHRVGVVETPTGDVDLDAVSPSLRLDGTPEPDVEQRTDEVNSDVVSPSVHCLRFCEDTSSSLQKKSSQPSGKRHTGRDRLSDVRAAILASAAAKLSSTTGRVSSAQLSNKSPDCLPTVKSSTSSSTGSDGFQSRSTVDWQSVSIENGTDTSSDDSSRLLNQFDEQSSESTRSSSSGRTEVSLTTQKPPTGRILVESSRLTKQTDRRNFDKASSFFRSLLTRSRSTPTNPANVSSCPAAGKSSRPNDLSLNNSLTRDRHSPGNETSDTSLVSSRSSPHYLSVEPCESLTPEKSLDTSVAESFKHSTSCSSTSSGTNLVYAANSHKSHSEHSKSLADCLKSENNTLPNSVDYQGEKLFTRDTVTTSVVISDIVKSSVRVDSVSSDNQGQVDNALNSPDRQLRSTAEIVINSAADNKPDIKRSEHQLSVDASPSQSRKIRKVVTFAEERNTGMSSLPLSSGCVTMNGEMQVESEKPTNNNPVMVTRSTASESVQLTSNNDDVAQSDIAFDVSNANTIQSDDEAAVDSNNFVSNIGRDLLQEAKSSVSARRNESAVTMNGHESNDLSAADADDSASISDVESEDLSSSQQDLHTLYQQRRAERLQEQKAAELEKQRLEEILKLCTEFGLSSDISSSLLVGEGDSSPAEKAESRNTLGRIKTNGSLTKLAGLPSTEPSSLVERQLNQSGSGSNSDDDVIDRGTVRRRPVTTKKLVDTSAVTVSKNTLPLTTASDRTASVTDKPSRSILARTGSGTLPTVGLSVEAAGRSKSVPMIDTDMTLVDGELERLLQSNIDFSLPTAADWGVGQTNHPSILKSSLDWYSASLPEYSSIWDSVNTWKSSQHRVSTN